MPSHLGEQIRAWRLQADLTQDDLAKLVGVKEVTVSRWERGVNNPGRRNIQAIRDATKQGIKIADRPERAAIGELTDKVYELAFELSGLEDELGEMRERMGELTEVWLRLKHVEQVAGVADPEAVVRAARRRAQDLRSEELADQREGAEAHLAPESGDPADVEDGEQPDRAAG